MKAVSSTLQEIMAYCYEQIEYAISIKERDPEIYESMIIAVLRLAHKKGEYDSLTQLQSNITRDQNSRFSEHIKAAIGG